MRFFPGMRYALVALVILALPGVVRSGEGSTPTVPPPSTGPHDGILTKTKAHAFETVFSSSGVSVYLYDLQMAPMLMQRVKAAAIVTVKGATGVEVPLSLDSPKEGEKTLFFCPMHAEVAQTKPGRCEACGGMELIPQDRVFGKLDLSKSLADVTATVTLKGFKGSESDVTFTVVWPAPAKK
jgi:hypothetical protein